MKLQSVTFVFIDWTIEFTRGTTEPYTGDVPKFKGKNYTWNVTMTSQKYGQWTNLTFASPTATVAKRYIQGVKELIKKQKQ